MEDEEEREEEIKARTKASGGACAEQVVRSYEPGGTRIKRVWLGSTFLYLLFTFSLSLYFELEGTVLVLIEYYCLTNLFKVK